MPQYSVQCPAVKSRDGANLDSSRNHGFPEKVLTSAQIRRCRGDYLPGFRCNSLLPATRLSGRTKAATESSASSCGRQQRPSSPACAGREGPLQLLVRYRKDPAVTQTAVIAAEDRRFYYHPGFDPISILRAAFTNLQRRKIVSGASTITQQVVRLIRPRPRTYKAKLLELLESLKMECQLSKEEILELYFNLSPMGGNVRGVGLAARLYFGKDVERISTAEAAILAAIPRSPSWYQLS